MSQSFLDIKFIKGVGEKRAQLFKKRLGLFTLDDLVMHYPKRYEDWSNPYRICDVPLDENVCIRAKISSEITEKVSYNKKITTYTFYIYDRTGQIRIVLFNNKYLAQNLVKDSEYLFYGKVKWDGVYREMTSPEIKDITEQKIRPIYKGTEGLSSKIIERIMPNAISLLKDEEFLPEYLTERFSLISHLEAVKQIHSPQSFEHLNAAVKRLSFEELFLLRLGFCCLKNRNRGFGAKKIKPVSLEEIKGLFPFSLTNAQIKVIKEALTDMEKNVPMNRLVQGDVGSGKTAVAAALCYAACKSGFMSALLAPTEILAAQHFNTFNNLFADKGIKVSLLTGSLTVKEKKKIKSDIVAGKIDILIATHAILTEDTALPNTALVITDEQHRFGVSQRSVLSKKADSPHTLVMSATPIPRTMGLIIYGDLDISVIDEVPAGRIPIESYAVDEMLSERALGYVKKHLDKGLQGYIVCPLVEDSEENTERLKSVKEYAETLKKGMFKNYNVGILHGKMKPKDKELVMSEFAEGKVQLLVATTVIEVGVDVPNAVIMVVENADRFGLSQLHQLRGRVGRGTEKSTCIFISATKNKQSIDRLKALCSTTDGFKIAEADLKQRGPGNFLGREQHGLPKLKIADMLGDTKTLNDSIFAANYILNKDPELKSEENKPIKTLVNKMFSNVNNIEFN